MGRQHPILI
ncbi:hypothetical protein KSF78_0008085 [Schistosoma japonicum]|nr:hypothetical protein KSF78_0008085 [Schistosoma japonicum]